MRCFLQGVHCLFLLFCSALRICCRTKLHFRTQPSRVKSMLEKSCVPNWSACPTDVCSWSNIVARPIARSIGRSTPLNDQTQADARQTTWCALFLRWEAPTQCSTRFLCCLCCVVLLPVPSFFKIFERVARILVVQAWLVASVNKAGLSTCPSSPPAVHRPSVDPCFHPSLLPRVRPHDLFCYLFQFSNKSAIQWQNI